jgi:hypothetical protein
MKRTLIFLGSLVGIFILASVIKDYIVKPPVIVPGGNSNPTVYVTPTSVNQNVQDHLPSGQTGVTQIDIPPVNQSPGIITQQHVVVTDSGNTLIVSTEKIDWGFRVDPKLILGYSGTLTLGIGTSLFKIWRFDSDVMLTGELSKDFTLKESIRLGVGESYQITNNAYVGVNCSWNADLNPKVGVYLSIKF